MRILAVDGGSSNTRITLVQNGKVLDRVKLAAGVRLTALSGSNIELLQAVRQGIQDILTRNQLEDKDVEAVLASGMIGSELGLYSVPHVTAPADLTKLAAHTQRVRLPEVCSIPFWFIPGVKNQADSLENADMMRGEETEFLGLCGIANPKEEVLALLPGTHTKLVTGSGRGAIIRCCTTLGGEMLAALSQNTILRSALPDPLSPTPDRGYVQKGYEAAKAWGLNQALFKVRVLHMFYACTPEERSGFFTGAVLAADIMTAARLGCGRKIIVGGSQPLRGVFSELLNHETGMGIVEANEETAELAAAAGAWRLWQIL